MKNLHNHHFPKNPTTGGGHTPGGPAAPAADLSRPGMVPRPPAPKTVIEALVAAATSFGPRLVVKDTAYDSASKADFGRPEQVFRALQAISEVAAKRLEAKREGRPMGALRSAFAERGFLLRNGESESTTNRYGRERTFANGGVSVFAGMHLTLGGGDKKNCLQVHFYFDDSSQVVVIVRCGRHLPTHKYH